MYGQSTVTSPYQASVRSGQCVGTLTHVAPVAEGQESPPLSMDASRLTTFFIVSLRSEKKACNNSPETADRQTDTAVTVKLFGK